MPANTDTYSVSIANAVRAEMERRKKKFYELCEPLNLSWPTVSGRLNGHKPFTLDEIEAAADFLGITVEDLHKSARLGDDATVRDAGASEALRITPPHDAWAQPSRSKRRSA